MLLNETKMSVTEVCRLCDSRADLIHIFKENTSPCLDRRKMIHVTTGVLIEPTDIVSQKVCSRCCKITLKMFQFRQDALKQDKALKDKCDQLLTRGMKLPNTNVIIRKDNSKVTSIRPVVKSEYRPEHREELKPQGSKRKSSNKPSPDIIHPSITCIFRQYPQLKLPKKCFSSHMYPTVSLNMGEVERYFKKRKLDMKKYVYVPKTGKKVAKKSTTTLPSNKKAKGSENQDLAGKKNSENRDATSGISKKLKFAKIREHKRSSSVDSVKSDSSSVINMARINKVKKNRKRIRSSSNDSLTSDNNGATLHSVEESNGKELNSVLENKLDKTPEGHDFNYLEDAPSTSDQTPETLSLKSRNLFVCNLCSSVHYSAAELKWHGLKHMVCQFCKSKFKSIEAKDAHIRSDCEVKKMMNSGPVVEIEKVDVVLEMRQKYPNAFVGFKLIPGLDIRPVEEVIIPESDMINASEEGDVIVLSDDDESSAIVEHTSKDPLFGDVTDESRGVLNLAPVFDNVTYNTVSVVKPDVRIKHNSVLNKIKIGGSDVQIIKELLSALAPEKQFVEKVVGTDLPDSKDIIIRTDECVGELKYLKEHLRVFKVPITIKSGPFNIAYRFKKQSRPSNNLQVWSNLPLVDVPSGTDSPSSTVANAKSHVNGYVRPAESVNGYSENVYSPRSINPTVPPHSPVIQVHDRNSNSMTSDSFFVNKSLSSNSTLQNTHTSYRTGTSSAANTNVYSPFGAPAHHTAPTVAVSQNSVLPLNMSLQPTLVSQPSEISHSASNRLLQAALKAQPAVSQSLVSQSTVNVQPSVVPYELPAQQQPVPMGVRVRNLWELR